MASKGIQGVFELLNGFRKSKVLFVATKLKVFDALDRDGPSTSNMLAKVLSLNEHALGTLLHSCVSLELLGKDKVSNKFYVGEVAKKYLVSESSDSLYGYIMHSNDVVYNLFSALETSVKTGGTCWNDSRLLAEEGRDEKETAKNAFSQLYKTEESLARFLRGMHGLSVSCAPSLVTAFDLSISRKLVDLGGGSGAMVVAAAQHYPNLHASVFDLASTLAYAHSSILNQTHATPLLMQRISLIPGNFFEDSLPDADIFVLSRIIHDWDAERATLLLRKVYEKLPTGGGGVLLCEMLLDEDGCGPIDTLLQSLNMLVQTGGQERSFSEYKSILEGVGFSDIRFKKTGQYLDAILATK